MGLDNMFMCCLLVVLIFVKHGESQGSFDIDDAVAAVASSASLMRPSYFHNYSYDDTNQMSIVDGGLNMYDTGNKIRIFVNASATKIQYGQTYRDKTSVFSSVATHPFVALWWIEKSQSTKYVMEVTSNFGSDSAGSSDTFQDSFVSGHTMVDVVGFQLYKAESNLSICEVFFFVKNLNSQMNSSSARLLFHNSPTNPGSDSVHMGILTGDMFNQVLFGYTLLSKRGGGVVTKLEIRTTVKAIVESISSQVGPTTTVMTTSSSDIGSSSGDGTTQAVDATVAQSGTVTSPTPIFSVTEMTKDLKQVLRSDDLSRGIAEFHRYSYDDSSANRISDGGNDMYDTGNMVYFTVNGIRTRAEYDRTYDGLGYTFSSVSVYPFVAFFVIDKDHTDAEPKNYSIQVISNLGADGGGYFHSENGTVTAGNYTLSYYTAQVYDAGDPSICEVYFHIRHNQTPEDANLKLNFTIPTRARQDMKNYVNRTGSKEPGILGYMLLSKYSTKVFTSEVRGILTDLLTDLSQRATILNSALYRTAENMKQRLLSSDLTKHLPDFFPYEYDDRSYPINSISDSSSDMYDTGNKVSFGIDDGNLVLAEYNQTYRRQPGFSFSVLAIHPFIAFFYINTTGEIDRNYTLQVASNLGADGTGSYQNFSGSVSGGGYVLSFHGAQVYGSGDASVCEVYFFISQNPGGKNFAFESPIRDRGMMRNTARLSGNIDEAVLGYTLLSTFTPGRQITQDELEATMLSTLSAIIGQEIMETTALATTQESFSQSTPATPTIPIQQNAAEISANLLNRFRSFDLTRYIHDFYRYKYDDITDPVNKINDGGSDMYDNGNEIYFTSNGLRTFAEYNQTYNLGYSFSTLAIHPFIAFFYINSNGRESAPYTIEVSSNLGADGNGNMRDFSGYVILGKFFLEFRGVQVYGANDASVCEVYFYTSRQGKNRGVFTLSSPLTSTNEINSVARLDGNIDESVFGYILLSTEDPGRQLTLSEIEATMRGVLELIVDLPTTGSNASTGAAEIPNVTTSPLSFNVTTSSVESNATDAIATEKSWKVDDVVDRIRSTNLIGHITDFHRYIYRTNENEIYDGGNDMYDYGNKVYFTVNGVQTRATYARTYNGSTYSFTSITGYPFVAFFTIDKIPDSAQAMNYSIQVISNLGADGHGIFLRFGDRISIGEYTVRYKAAEVAESSDATVCEVYFHIYQEASGTLNFTTPIRDRQNMKNFLNLTESREAAILGYVLLAKPNGARVSSSEVRTSMTNLLRTVTSSFEVTETALTEAVNSLVQRFRATNLTRRVTDFHRYTYDDRTPLINQISDGGDDMYDGGNQVYFEANHVETLADYHRTYRSQDYIFSILPHHPFIAFFYINSTDGENENFSIRVNSNLGADGSGTFQNFSGSVSLAVHQLSFHGVQVFGAGDASVCEVFFHVTLSGSGEAFTFSSPQRDRREIRSKAVLRGNIGEAVLGYMMLSTEDPGRQITQDELEATMLDTLSVIFDQEALQNTTVTPEAGIAKKSHQEQIADVTYVLLTRLRYANVTQNIPEFHTYVYDDIYAPVNKMSDGGNDMFDTGNKVYFTVDGKETLATYNETYTGPDYTFSTIANHPFIAMFYINLTEPSNKTFSIRLSSNLGADGYGTFHNFSGSVSLGGYQLFFSGVQVYGAGDASVCEVFFHVLKTESGGEFLFSSPAQTRENLASTGQLYGITDEAILGYMLLSTKSPGLKITQDQLETTMRMTLGVILGQFVAPTEPPAESPQRQAITEATNSLLNRLQSSNLTKFIPDFHRYTYDTRYTSSIPDGGDDMFDTGNMVYISVNGNETLVNYNKTYYGLDYSFSTLAIHPFVAFFYINSTGEESGNFSIRVNSDLGADGSGTFQNFSGSVSLAVHQLSFHGVQVFRAGDASVCEVFFHVSLPGSGEAFTFTSPQRDRREIHSKAVLSGNISEAVLGYMMLSTEDPGRQITQDELEATMLNTLSVIFDQEAPQNTTVVPEAKNPHQEQIADVTKVLLTRLRYANVTQNIPEFHTYGYDDVYAPVNKMLDGGNDMYDTGNEVYFTVDGMETLATYNETYTGPDYTFSTIANHPFISMFYINLTEPSNKTFSIRLSSNLGADGSGTFHNFSGSVSLGGYQLVFSGVQVYGAGDASVCEVFFYVLKNQSGGNFLFSSPSQARSNLESTAQLYGITDEAILGYMLLSTKSPGLKITQDQLETTMHMTLGVILGQYVAPSEPPAESPHRQAITEATNSLLHRLQSSNLTKSIPDFHRYTYSGMNSIPDGGNDMFDTGNMVYLSVNGNETLVNYNKTYYGPDYSFSTLAIHPFVAFFYINRTEAKGGNFSIRLVSDLGADGGGQLKTIRGAVRVGDYNLVYRGAQVYGAGNDASVCKVFFYVIKLYNIGETFHFTNPFRETLNLNYEASLSGRFDNALLGYILLSTQSPGRKLTDAEIDATMLNMLYVILDQEPPQNITTTDATTSTVLTDEIRTQLALTTGMFQSRFRSANLVRHIQNFHSYRYDDTSSPNTLISDGGNDMYDGGNQVYFTVDDDRTSANYNQNYTGPGYTFSTLSIHPFVAFFTFYTNSDKTFGIEVRSNLGADGSGTFQNFSGSLSLNEFFLKFEGVQVYGADDASVCEVYFYAGMEGQERGYFDFESPIQNRKDIRSTATVSGDMGSGILGYILLSTEPDREITQGELDATMLDVLELVSTEPAETSMNETDTYTNTSTVETVDSTVPTLSDVARIFQERLRSANLERHIQNFHSYQYDDSNTPQTKINDGGSDMYDDGNEVYFTANEVRRKANYNQNYNDSGWTFSTLPVHPFMAFFTLATDSRDDSVYIIEVESNLGADGSGTFQNFSGSLSLNGFFLEFQGIQVFGADDPSVCEVYFYINTERRNGGIFEFESPRQDRQYIRSTAKVRNHFGSGMLGYVLLSTEPDREITQDELDAIMLNVLQLVSVQTIEMPPNVTITNTSISTVNATDAPVRSVADVTRVFHDRFRSANLDRHIRNFHSYQYDDSNTPQTMIYDGGNDMYDDGNMVYFIVDDVKTLVNYSQIYEGSGYTFSTLPVHPFMAFFTLVTNSHNDKAYTIEVRSNLGADGSGTFHNFSGSLSHNGFILKFQGVQVYGADDASVCEVYFYVVQQEVNHGTFEFESPETDRQYIQSTASVRNHIGSGMLGYILLSTEPDRKITQGELDATMLNVLQLVSMDISGIILKIPSPEVKPNTTKTTATETTDELFLPSCTAKVAMNSIFRCDAIFSKPARRFKGQDTCRSVLDQLFRCISFQIYQCYQGWKENYFDTLVPSNFNSEVFISYSHNLPNSRKNDKNNFVDTFCHHAANKLDFPFEYPYLADLCYPGVVDDLVEETGKFMYTYLWSRNATDVCPAFQTLRSWFVNTTRNRCSFDFSGRFQARQTRQYLNRLVQLVIAAVDEMQSSICTINTQPERLVIKEFEDLMLGGKPSQPKKQDGSSSKRRRSQRNN